MYSPLPHVGLCTPPCGLDKNNLVILAMHFKQTTGMKECLSPITLKVEGRYSLEE